MKKIVSVLLAFAVCLTVLAGCGGNTPPETDKQPDVSQVAFEDVTVTYDGTKHVATVSDLPDGVRVDYKDNEQTYAGTYEASAELYFGDELLKTLQSTLTINKRKATVAIDDKTSAAGLTVPLTYRQDGVIEGDDLGITLSVKTNKNGIKQIESSYTNPNYDVTFTGGKYTVIGTLLDGSDITVRDVSFSPVWAPFVLQDTALFSQSVVTSFSFWYGGLNGKTVTDKGLTLPLYVVPKTTTSSNTVQRSDYTEANGKKIVLDFTGKLADVKVGDLLTVDDLHIEIGENETLAFGDTDMVVLPLYTRSAATYSFYSRIFGDGAGQAHAQSLLFKIEGYGTREPDPDGKKLISFLGDSISTYAGYSNAVSYNPTIGNNEIWFPNLNYTGANMKVEKTWWHRTLTALDYKLCVNNSWSGSVVNTPQTYNVRAKNLHNADRLDPDVIVIFMGVNDFAANTAVGTYDGTTDAPASPSDFSTAYGRTVQTIMKTYPDADVYCCTFLPDRKRFKKDTNGAGISETDYNDAIRIIAQNLGAELIDLYEDSGITPANVGKYTVDKLHPNDKGMQLIADLVMSTIRGVHA